MYVYYGKAIPWQAWRSPEGSMSLEAPIFQDNRHMKVIRLSALSTGRLNPPRSYSWYSFLLKAESTGLTPSGIEPATYRLVAQFLNLLRHLVPQCNTYLYKLTARNFQSCFGVVSRLCQMRVWNTFSNFVYLGGPHIACEQLVMQIYCRGCCQN
jgi:hypothetical protein